MKKYKKQLLNDAKKYLEEVLDLILNKRKKLNKSIKKGIENRKLSVGGNNIVEEKVLSYQKKRVEELKLLLKSPYFFKCRIKFDHVNEEEDVFIGKFNFSEEKIYSWVSPASKLRFEGIGRFSYDKPDGTIREGDLIKKDQFMIADGKIIYMATESEDSPRELVYQEHLSNRKTGFILPDIIAKMEKSQDEVIRADYKGSYLISGPAGSGKTTLALHRVAHLALSPDSSDMFPGSNIVLFVQDEKTLEYFKSIFPQLGIDDVVILTFHTWALQMLNIEDYEYVYRYGDNDKEKDEYEYFKNSVLKNFDFSKEKINVDSLSSFYLNNLNEKYTKLLTQQLAEKKLDRFDLIILLKSKLQYEKELKRDVRVVVEKDNGEPTLEDRSLAIQYSLIIIDEAQNYLEEEIAVLKTCVNTTNNSILYTGDLAQQTKLCTLKDWGQVGEDFDGDRKIVLDKVYRNTKEILKYIKSKGYDIFIPEELSEGVPVQEKSFKLKVDEIDYVSGIIEDNKKSTIGVLSKDGDYLMDYKEKFKGTDNIHILTISESQGVEFDISIIVGHEHSIESCHKDEELRKEKESVVRDLNYVAMTRAMNELWVCLVGK